MIRVELDEVLHSGQPFSRRPRACAQGIEVVATRKSDSVVCALARKLMEAGQDPAEPMECWRGPVLALRVCSVGEAARLTASETDAAPRIRRNAFAA
jgi:hypothetical protein